MKLLTLNTHSLIEPEYEAKRDAFVEFIRREQPDVFALQEVNQTAAAPLLADVPAGYYPCPGNMVLLKADNHAAAVARLREALDDYKKFPLDSVRDGTIQRFEFCTELAWKTMREYLLDQGYTNINSPKEVIKQAFAFGMIDDQKAWVELLNDRNLTSHVYDEATAAAIFARIEGQYLPLFDSVTAYMKDE